MVNLNSPHIVLPVDAPSPPLPLFPRRHCPPVALTPLPSRRFLVNVVEPHSDAFFTTPTTLFFRCRVPTTPHSPDRRAHVSLLGHRLSANIAFGPIAHAFPQRRSRFPATSLTLSRTVAHAFPHRRSRFPLVATHASSCLTPLPGTPSLAPSPTFSHASPLIAQASSHPRPRFTPPSPRVPPTVSHASPHRLPCFPPPSPMLPPTVSHASPHRLPCFPPPSPMLPPTVSHASPHRLPRLPPPSPTFPPTLAHASPHHRPRFPPPSHPPFISSSRPHILVSSHPPVLSSSFPLILLSSHPPFLSSSLRLIFLSSHPPFLSPTLPLIPPSAPPSPTLPPTLAHASPRRDRGVGEAGQGGQGRRGVPSALPLSIQPFLQASLHPTTLPPTLSFILLPLHPAALFFKLPLSDLPVGRLFCPTHLLHPT
ncbi:unnamed protein product [Closterium sp. Naga37s-1]|nr:unnamed protein product [Closterium sp. Naga37s-1]